MSSRLPERGAASLGGDPAALNQRLAIPAAAAMRQGQAVKYKTLAPFARLVMLNLES
ncbi:hypothetical protein [Bosea sp. F3-2]|uniref:hypothetical protein n=1 Tax=Bosea sp. F3-2 TaxID=2599640 RepID=UPI0016552951|nr:hypothetical protein [Bosea sp. F3-2]